jgi:hypothetical protein
MIIYSKCPLQERTMFNRKMSRFERFVEFVLNLVEGISEARAYFTFPGDVRGIAQGASLADLVGTNCCSRLPGYLVAEQELRLAWADCRLPGGWAVEAVREIRAIALNNERNLVSGETRPYLVQGARTARTSIR